MAWRLYRAEGREPGREGSALLPSPSRNPKPFSLFSFTKLPRAPHRPHYPQGLKAAPSQRDVVDLCLSWCCQSCPPKRGTLIVILLGSGQMHPRQW